MTRVPCLLRYLSPVVLALLLMPGLAGCSEEPTSFEQTAPHGDRLDVIMKQKLFSPVGGAGDWFGFGTAIEGDTALVGAPYNDAKGVDAGAAHIFTRSNGVWVEEQQLDDADMLGGGSFGFSVDIEGDTAIVAAPLNDEKGMETGAVYVFTRSGGSWTKQVKLVPSDGLADDRFGNAVDLDGDTLVVAAWAADIDVNKDSVPEVNVGSVYVFTRSGGVWEQKQKLVAEDAAADDGFGFSIAVEGDTIFGGAYLNEAEGVMNSGATYVFTRVGETWTQTQKLVAEDSVMGKDVTSDASFGSSASILGDTAAVGAAQAHDNSGAATGAVYTFTRSGGTWAPQQKLVPSDLLKSDSFGLRVSLSGDALVSGAHLHAPTSGIPSGAVYVFTQADGAWTQQEKIVPDIAPSQFFGLSLALSGDTVLVGAVGDKNAMDVVAGSATAFVLHGFNGDPCASGAECVSGFCVDGVCCNKACAGGVCDACSIAAGASENGECEPFPGVTCNDGDACTEVDACDESGACGGAKPVVCVSKDACQLPGACDSITGLCTPPTGEVCSEDGEPEAPSSVITCSSAAECASGFCVDGVCCDSACDEPCHSCVLFPNLGKCTLSPAGVDLRLDCYPVQNCLRTCGGNGQCIGAGPGVQCAPNRCVDRNRGEGPAFCADIGAECPVDESVPFDCAPYVCEPAFGACRSDCRSNAECADGYACDITGVCVTPPDVQQSSAGCGVVARGRSDGISMMAWLLALATLMTRRARSSRRPVTRA